MNQKEEEIVKKYNLDIGRLEKEQIKLSERLSIKDSMDFKEVSLVGGFEAEFEGNNIISSLVVVDSEMEIVDQTYSTGKVKFPYLPGFRAYREMPIMIQTFNKLEERPDVVFIKGHGIIHSRLGFASHFSLSTGVPTIGVSESLMEEEEIKGDDVMLNGKIVGKVFQSKPGARPLYVSPGNLISVKTAFELTKRFMKYPHKLPEPLHLAAKYGKKMRGEVF